MMYAIHGGIYPDYVSKSLEINAHEIIKDLTKKIDRLNKYTHITKKIFYENDKKIPSEIVSELNIFSEFLTEFQNCKHNVVEKLNDSLCNHITNEFLSSTMFDHLSTHHFVEDISIDSSTVKEINDATIKIEVDGSIHVVQQYGSSTSRPGVVFK